MIGRVYCAWCSIDRVSVLCPDEALAKGDETPWKTRYVLAYFGGKLFLPSKTQNIQRVHLQELLNSSCLLWVVLMVKTVDNAVVKKTPCFSFSRFDSFAHCVFDSAPLNRSFLPYVNYLHAQIIHTRNYLVSTS